MFAFVFVKLVVCVSEFAFLYVQTVIYVSVFVKTAFCVYLSFFVKNVCVYVKTCLCGVYVSVRLLFVYLFL